LWLVRLLTAAPNSMPEPIDWDRIPVEYPLEGVARQTVHGASQTLVRYIYQPGSVFPIHQHPEEQITIVLSGSIDFTVDGVPLTLSAGECALIPANTPHGATVTAAEIVETLNTMSPKRMAAPSVGSIDEDVR
jgi:quercetin dioxygenase-like cupin family protein